MSRCDERSSDNAHTERRKRPRSFGLSLRAALLVAVCLPQVAAFAPSSLVRQLDQRASTALTHRIKTDGVDKTSIPDAKDTKSRWLQWMMTGSKPRGTQKVSLTPDLIDSIYPY